MHEFVPLTAGDFHIARAGHGRPMLFLHGFPQCWYEWRHQLDHFRVDHLVVAPDLRGYNRSAKPEGVDAYRLESLVDDVAELVDTLGFERVTLVGHDWGGMVAWTFAAAHPQRLDRLVVLDAPHPVPFDRALRADPATQAALGFYGLFRGPRAEEVLAGDDFARMASWFAGVSGPDDLAVYREAWSQPGALTATLNWYRAADAGPPDPDRGRPEGGFVCGFADEQLTVSVPTLVIWGEDSLLPLSVNDGLEEFVSDLTVEILPKTGHWIPEERPDQVNRLIRDFLAR